MENLVISMATTLSRIDGCKQSMHEALEGVPCIDERNIDVIRRRSYLFFKKTVAVEDHSRQLGDDLAVNLI